MIRKYSFIPLILVMLLTGCAKDSNVQVKGEDNTFIMLKSTGTEESDVSDIYVKYEGKDEEKVASDIPRYNKIEYLEGEKSIIIQDEDNNLNKYPSEGDKEKIGSDIISGESSYMSYEVSGNNKTIAYLTDDESLYVKYPDKDKEKVASNVYYYDIDNFGDYIYYKNSENELYSYNNKAEKNKIAVDVDTLKISDDGQNVIFIDVDGSLYIKNINSDEKVKIDSGDIEISSVNFHSDDSITYLNDYNYENSKGELYIYTPKEDSKTKIASDVTSYERKENKFYYITADETLYEKSIDEQKSSMILSDVQYMRLVKDRIVYVNNDEEIYTKDGSKEPTKIGTNIMGIGMLNIINEKEVVYLTKDNELFIGKDKIASEVVNYVNNSKIIAYVTKDKEVHSYNLKNKKDNVEISNAKNYSEIYLEDKLLFSNSLEPYELTGFWSVGSSTYDNFILEFSGSSKLIFYTLEGEKYTINYNVDSSSEDYLFMTGKGEYEDSQITINRVDDKNINITIDDNNENTALGEIDVVAIKISKQQVNDFLSKKTESTTNDVDLTEDIAQETGDAQSLIKELIKNYEYDYVRAVNSGDFSIVSPYLIYNGKLYNDHLENIYNYYERGISETLYEAKVQGMEKINDREYRVKVYEKIGIIKEGDENVKEFNSTYVIEFDGTEWLIREMI